MRGRISWGWGPARPKARPREIFLKRGSRTSFSLHFLRATWLRQCCCSPVHTTYLIRTRSHQFVHAPRCEPTRHPSRTLTPVPCAAHAQARIRAGSNDVPRKSVRCVLSVSHTRTHTASCSCVEKSSLWCSLHTSRHKRTRAPRRGGAIHICWRTWPSRSSTSSRHS